MESSVPVVQTTAETVAKSDVPLRSDEMSLTLQPNEGSEIKATMRKGEQFVYNWAVEGGSVNVDIRHSDITTGSRIGAGQAPGRFLFYDINRLDCIDFESRVPDVLKNIFRRNGSMINAHM